MSKAPENGGEVSFEQALAELEGVVRQLEEGNLGLNESLAQYEHGVRRLKECYALLQRAERRIELLERVDAEGEPVTQPFDDEATIERHERSAEGGEEPARGKAKTPQPKTPRRRTASKPSDAEPRDLF